ncbi:hypothetical protein H4R18_004317 [Coemansia javaensis]|uniref:TLC domain-containing protein n=1 Tax=Coemansia javaensis TaxID=2761396 RepID=A0A9W8H619_9FUNG|nr:hypothetical protein H4R18_004317 [Coemansia javaensis]
MFGVVVDSHQSWWADRVVHSVFDPLHLDGVGNYWRIVLASLVFHVALFRATPMVSRAVVPRVFGRLGAAEQEAWCVSVTTMVHSVTDVAFVVAYFGEPAINADRMGGYSAGLEWWLAVAMGYYTWDLAVCLADYGKYGAMYLVHAGLGVAGLAILLSRQLQYFALPYLLPEASSVFLHVRALLKLAGLSHTLAYKANFVLFLVAYVCIRIGYEAHQSWLLVVEVWHGRTAGAYRPFAVFFAVLGVTLTVLNLIWFRQIINAAYHTLAPRNKTLGSSKPGSKGRRSD